MSAKRGQKSKTSEKAPATESGEPGGGRGRTDHVGRSPVYPGSGPWPSGNVEIRTPGSFVHGQRDDQGREIAGGSEPIYFNQEVLLGDLTPIQSLIASGSKVWLDSVDPEEVARNRSWGITGATSNPIIVADLVKTGRLDERPRRGSSRRGWMITRWPGERPICWSAMPRRYSRQSTRRRAAMMVTSALSSTRFWKTLSQARRPAESRNASTRKSERGATSSWASSWSHGHRNRMIKVPATESGLAALEELAAAGVTVNVTLTFTPRQYVAARDALWRGASGGSRWTASSRSTASSSAGLTSTQKSTSPGLSAAAQGQLGIVNAKRIWRMNQEFWADKKLPLNQEIVFASTGPKKASEPPWKYVEAFAGSGIETNPPKINAAIQASGRAFPRSIDRMPPDEVLAELDAKVDMAAS